MANYKHTILFVDDEKSILRSFERLFRKKNVEVLTASEGSEALHLLNDTDNPVSLIISDQQMPNMSGTQFLEHTKRIVPDAIRFLLTGYSDLQSTIDSINKGEINRYLRKPWNDIELMQHVDVALNQYELIMENRRLLEMTQKQNHQLFEFGKTMERKVRGRSEELHKKNRELEATVFNTVRAFATLAEMSTPLLKGHGNRVSMFSAEIAEHMGLDEEEVLNIEMAGLLHDIGKVGLPQSVMNCFLGTGLKGELKEKYRKHAEEGQNILSFSDKLNKIGIYVRHHHEQYDGQGFPDTLSGEAIPLGSRIIAVTDTYDRISYMKTVGNMYHKKYMISKIMTQDHLSSEEIAREAAIYHIKQNAFTQFDPEIIKYLIQIHYEKGGIARNETIHSINQLEEGMMLARPLNNRQGHLLLPNKVVLTANIIDRLKIKRGIGDIADSVFILSQNSNYSCIKKE